MKREHRHELRVIFVNKAKVKIDFDLLNRAVMWWAGDKRLNDTKIIFFNGNYAAIAIGKEKLYLNRLIKAFMLKRKLRENEHVVHKDKDQLNLMADNLLLIDRSLNLSLANKGRKQTKEHIRKRIMRAARTRRIRNIKKGAK